MAQTGFGQGGLEVKSPDGHVFMRVRPADAVPRGASAPLYGETGYDGTTLVTVPLGITRKDQAFTEGLKLVAAGPVTTIDEPYTMLTGKRKLCRNHANEQAAVFQNPAGAQLELIVRAHNDGV